MHIANTLPDYDIPLACEAITIELRGELCVNDIDAKNDAMSILKFLTRRGYLAPPVDDLEYLKMPPLLCEENASPLSGVDMIEVSY
jgi:predicted deacylase